MKHAVEVYFDGQTEAQVRQLWQRVASHGIDSPLSEGAVRPHLSLAVFDQADGLLLQEAVAAFASHCPPLWILFAFVGAFPAPEGVVFLAPVVTSELLEMHAVFHKRLRALGLVSQAHYQPGRWVPHCTVAIRAAPEQMVQAVDLCLRSEALGPATLAQIGLVACRPVRPLCTLPLKAT